MLWISIFINLINFRFGFCAAVFKYKTHLKQCLNAVIIIMAHITKITIYFHIKTFITKCRDFQYY